MVQRCHNSVRPTTLALAILFLSEPIVARAGLVEAATGSVRRPPHEWTVDERLAERFDAVAIERRNTASRSSRSGSTDPLANDNPPRTDDINGAEHPELFLPFELFDALVHRGFPEIRGEQTASRQRILEGVAALGFGADFWQRLETVIAPFLRLRRRDMRLGQAEAKAGVSEAKSARDPVEFCRARADSFAAAAREFGERPFLRLLYDVVAPGVNRTYVVTDTLEAELRYHEGGCR